MPFIVQSNSMIGASDAIDLWVTSLPSEGKERPLVALPGGQREPRFSPDGRYLAYDSSEDGQMEVWVRPFPGPGGAVKVSNEGGHNPLWSPDGRELYYRNGRRIMAVEIETAFVAGKPELLFVGPELGRVKHWRAWDIAADGERFAAVEHRRSCRSS